MSKPATEDGFGSRKFIVTVAAMGLGSFITLLSMYSAPPEGFFTALSAFFILLGTCVGAYQWANLRHHQSNGGGE